MPPLTSKAQIVRAILLASATDTTLTGRLCSMVRIQSGTFNPRLASLMIEVAPTIKSVRRLYLPSPHALEPVVAPNPHGFPRRASDWSSVLHGTLWARRTRDG